MQPSDFWRPFEEQIASFDDVVKVIDKLMQTNASSRTQFAWRGQVNADWPLHSSLYRRLNLTKNKTCKEIDMQDAEGEILKELHRWGLHNSDTKGRLSILNQLAILQHYGAPTRLIDITFNAWVAVWFAVEPKWENAELKYQDRDARLFAFDITNRLINENDALRDWEDSLTRPWKKGDNGFDQKEWATSVYAWKPSNLDARIAAQNGGFLLGGVPVTTKSDNKRFQFPKTPNYKDGWWLISEARTATSLAFRPNVFGRKRSGKENGSLYTFRIKANAKEEIRNKLEKMFGFKHSTIYPDFSGFADFGTPNLKSY